MGNETLSDIYNQRFGYEFRRDCCWLVCGKIWLYVHARSTHGCMAECANACRAHSHGSHTGELAQLSGKTA